MEVETERHVVVKLFEFTVLPRDSVLLRCVPCGQVKHLGRGQ